MITPWGNIHPLVLHALQFRLTAVVILQHPQSQVLLTWVLTVGTATEGERQNLNSLIFLCHDLNIKPPHEDFTVPKMRWIFMHPRSVCRRKAHQNVSVINLISLNMVLLNSTLSLSYFSPQTYWSSSRRSDYWSITEGYYSSFKSLKLLDEYRWSCLWKWQSWQQHNTLQQ